MQTTFGMAEERVVGGRLLRRTRRRPRRPHGRTSSAARSATSSTRPPRAQLMMRTPFLVLASVRGEDVPGLLRHRHVQRDDVGAAQQVVQLHLLDAEFERALRRQERIVGDDPHPQADGAVGDDRADIAAADHAERLGGELDAHEAVLLPLAGLRGGVGLRDLAREREHHARWRARRW